MPGGPAATAPPLPELAAPPAESVLDLVDSLLNKGAVVSGDVVLGLAGIDLVYLQLSALLAAADRVMGGEEGGRRAAQRGGVALAGPDERLDEASGGRAPVDADPRPEPARAAVAAADAVGPEGARPDEAEGRVTQPSVRPDVPRPTTSAGRPGVAEAEREIDELRAEIERGLPADRPPRWNADPEDVERSVAKLVLTLVELVRQLLERQALRRMEEGTLSQDEVETLGRALMRLEETVHAIAGRFGIPPEELNLDLGPLGRLL